MLSQEYSEGSTMRKMTTSQAGGTFARRLMSRKNILNTFPKEALLSMWMLSCQEDSVYVYLIVGRHRAACANELCFHTIGGAFSDQLFKNDFSMRRYHGVMQDARKERSCANMFQYQGGISSD